MSGAPTETPSDLLRDYLASHDEACPGCGYNLRGNTVAQCPECGQGLSLAVRTPGGVGRRRGLLLLLFAWLLMAGAMNVYRSGRAAYQTASTWRQVMWTSLQFPTATVPAPASLRRLSPSPQPAPRMPMGFDLATGSLLTSLQDDELNVEIQELISRARADETDAADVPAAGQSDGGEPEDVESAHAATAPEDAASGLVSLTAAQITIDTTGAIIASGRPTLRAMSPSSPGPQWSRVTWKQWAATSWWATLSLVATSGLIVLLVGGRRLSDRMSAALVITAWVAFAGYFTYHTLHFLRDVM